MTWKIPKIIDDSVIQLSKRDDAEIDLYKFTYGELQLLNEEIEKMAEKYQDDFEILIELMQLKTHSMHITNFAKKRDQEYR